MTIDTDRPRWQPIITSLTPRRHCLGPLTKFVNRRTGSVVITRDVQAYRAAPDWQAQPFDLQSPVPRRPT
jgi:hypothetical protein